MKFKKYVVISVQLHPLYNAPAPNQLSFSSSPCFLQPYSQGGLPLISLLSSDTFSSPCFHWAHVYVPHFVRPQHLWLIWRTTAYCPCLQGNPYSTELEGKLYDFSIGWGSDSSSGHRWGKCFLTHFMDLVWLWKERFKDRLGVRNCWTEKAKLLCAKE